MWILRKILHPMDELAANEFLIDQSQSNQDQCGFLRSDEALGRDKALMWH